MIPYNSLRHQIFDLPDHAINNIGGVFLPMNTVWVDRRSELLIRQTIDIALDGSVHEYSQAVSVGQSILLDCSYREGDNRGSIISETKYLELRPLAAAVSAEYQFDWSVYDRVLEEYVTESYNVMFDHSSGPALPLEHLSFGTTDAGNWTGTIKLIRV